jgi:putative membrane protein
MMMNGWMYGWMWIWPLLVLAGLLLLIYGMVRLAQGSPSLPGSGQRGSSARQILDERFARGEIDEDDYRRRCAELS